MKISCKFEDGRYSINSGSREGTSDLNPVFALATIKFVLQATIEASCDLGVDADRREKWQHVVDHLSDYPTTEVNGVTMLMEAESYGRQRGDLVCMGGPGDNPVVLEMVHPAEAISLGSSQRWRAIAKNTIAYMNSNPNRLTWDNYCALPKIFTQAARVGWDADDLHYQIDRKIKRDMQPNLTVFPRWYGGGIEHAGMVEAVNSMLMQSHEGIIRVFPVWPRSKDAKFARLRAKYAFLVSSELKNGKVQYVTILSEKGRDCKVQNPWPGKAATVEREHGSNEILTEDEFTIGMKQGETVRLRP